MTRKGRLLMLKSCADARWSGFRTLSDVPDAEFEEFITHSDGCEFHQAVLHEEERPLLEAARRARSLSDDGRVPAAPEEVEALLELHQNYQRWRQLSAPVESLSLRYRGEEVARHERVLQIGARVRKELKGAGDLQIWKLPDDASPYPVLLDTYPIEGFSHAGAPRLRELASGQQIMLCVKRLDGDVYEIVFACADMSEPEDFFGRPGQGQAAGAKKARGAAASAAKGFEGFSSFSAQTSGTWHRSQPFNRLAAAASIAIVLALLVGTLPLLRHARGSGRRTSSRPAPFDIALTPNPSEGVGQTAPPDTTAATSQDSSASKPESPTTERFGEESPRPTASDTAARPSHNVEVNVVAQAAPELTAAAITPSSEIQPKTVTQLPEAGGPAAGFYYTTDGPAPQTLLVRAAVSELVVNDLVDAFRKIPGQVTDKPGLSENVRVLDVTSFDWGNSRGTLRAHLNEEEGRPVAIFNCTSVAVSPAEARAQAVEELIKELYEHLRAPSEVGAVRSISPRALLGGRADLVDELSGRLDRGASVVQARMAVPGEYEMSNRHGAGARSVTIARRFTTKP
jgi:hypothetical protein